MNLALVRGILTCLLVILAAASQAQQRYVEGVHYRRIANPAAAVALGSPDDGSKSVLEIFWYGCGHCYAFDPLLNDWVARKADSIVFTRSPMVWDAATKQHARLFHATQALGLHDKMHTPIFDAIHRERNFLLDDASTAAFFAGYGVNEATYTKTASSFALDATLRKTETAQRALKIPSVPALIVNGRWLINTTPQVATHQAMLDVADYLLNQYP